MRSERYRWGLVCALLVMLAVVRAGAPSERDPYWSARAGIETLQGSPLARSDTWSWSADGTWYPNSPAWNVVLGLGWESLGFWGFFWVALLAMCAFFALSIVAAQALGARAIPTFIAFAPLMLGASAALSARATVVVQAVLVAAVLFAWRWAPRAARLHWTAAGAIALVAGFAFSFVGNWVHLSFMLWAAVLAGVWALVWWFAGRMPRGRLALLSTAGALGLFGGCVFSPYGIPLTFERSRAVAKACTGLIVEWTSVWGAAGLGDPRWIAVGAIGLVASLGTAWWVFLLARRRGRFDRAVGLAVPLAVVAIPVTLVGLGAIRFLVAGMLLLAPLAATALTATADVVHGRRESRGWAARPKVAEYSSGRFWSVLLSALAVVMLPMCLIFASQGARPPEAGVVGRLPHGCLLFSDAASAAVVILTRPDVQVWTDTRADFYGRERIAAAPGRSASLVEVPDGATCAIVSHTTKFVGQTAEWAVVGSSGGFELRAPR